MQSQSQILVQTVNDSINDRANKKLAIDMELDRRAEAIKHAKKLVRIQATLVGAALIGQGLTQWTENVSLLLEDSEQRETLTLGEGITEEIEDQGGDELTLAVVQNAITHVNFTAAGSDMGATFVDGIKDTLKKYGCINSPDTEQRQRDRKRRNLAEAVIEAYDDLLDARDSLVEVLEEIDESPFANHPVFQNQKWNSLRAMRDKSQNLFSPSSDSQASSTVNVQD